MNISLISDTHLEFGHQFQIPSFSDILILAGDIGTFPSHYDEFLGLCSSRYKYIIVVPGNCEYHHKKGYEFALKELKKIASLYNNIFFLDRDYIDINGYRFLGCTLWTDIPNNQKKHFSKHILNLYKFHDLDKSWLKESVEQSPLPVVVITHHSPMFDTFPKKDDYIIHSDQTCLINDKIVLWCHGSMHKYRKYQFNNTLIWCNPVGYSTEKTRYEYSEIVKLKNLF